MIYNYNENISIYYEKYGKSKKNSIIIFPGWGDNRKTFDSIIKALKDTYTIYIFDYPGFGKSTIKNETLTIYNYAEIFRNFMKDNNIKNPIVIGHSFGGRIIILLSGKYNIKFNKIILMSSAGIKHTNNKIKLKTKIYKFLKKISEYLPKKIKNKYLYFLVKIFGSNDFKSVPNSLKNTFINIVNEDLKEYLSNIDDETLILWGENDVDTPIEDAYLMNSSIKKSGLVIIKNTHHFFYLEKEKYVNKIIITYLKS